MLTPESGNPPAESATVPVIRPVCARATANAVVRRSNAFVVADEVLYNARAPFIAVWPPPGWFAGVSRFVVLRKRGVSRRSEVTSRRTYTRFGNRGRSENRTSARAQSKDLRVCLLY